MTFLTITVTRLRRLAKPAPLPNVTGTEARAWFSGWWHGIAAGAVIGLGFGVLAGQAFAAQPEIVGVHIGSHHLNPAPAHVGQWKNANPGVYARWANGFTVGTLRNSERRQSVYAGWTIEGPRAWTIRPSATVGVITGYAAGPFPLAAIGIATSVTDRASVRVSWLPKAGDHGSHALHLSMEWSLK